MGEVAASGGYWVTCIGQPIYAEQGTITGSIGVFSLKISIGSLLRRVGVHVETVALDDSAASTVSIDPGRTKMSPTCNGSSTTSTRNSDLCERVEKDTS